MFNDIDFDAVPLAPVRTLVSGGRTIGGAAGSTLLRVAPPAAVASNKRQPGEPLDFRAKREPAKCGHCKADYVPTTKTQKYCSKCTADTNRIRSSKSWRKRARRLKEKGLKNG